MYCVKRTERDAISYLKYDGWDRTERGSPLDLNDVVLFTEREIQMNELPSNQEFQWYGAYKR